MNAALTIQLFSQLFHFINMYLFNIVMKEPELRCKGWGTRIRLRLSRVEAWAEKQGLELAAECHLARVTQAMNLLKGSKEWFLRSLLVKFSFDRAKGIFRMRKLRNHK